MSRSGFIPRLQWIATKHVLLWDEAEKRGWLVNGTSALLHIVRASLAYNNTDKFNSAFIFREKNFKESTTPFTADSAIDMLINPKNLALKLYREKDGYLSLESRIEYFYNILEKLIDHQADIAGERGVNMADKPRRYLEGWEFNDLVMSRDPLYPRVASLEPRGKSWVDFTRAIHAVTLFGNGFGDIMKSTSADMCEHWAELPKEKYYLAACLSDMNQLVRDNKVHNESQVRVSKDIIWHTPTSLFRTCRCRGILGQNHDEPVQSLLPMAMSKILLPRKIAIPLEPGSRGAIIFGHHSNFSWVYGDSGPPSEGKLPPPNISDVDSAKDSGIDLSMSNMDSPRLGIVSSSVQRTTEPPDNRHLETSTPQSTSLNDNEAFSQEDYTVGILCALSKELLAVRALFDKKHSNLETSLGDTNHYALGQMGKHMVVTSCLPEGDYGTTSAADSAANMRRSFPNIRFCLLVGIGGGAPTQDNDIRLGDVVVSLPVGKYPGIIQYDRGKENENNVFELTGSLPPPPRYLMTAISSLRSDPDLPSYPLRPYIDEILNRVSESVGWRYKHPGQDHDQLFKMACSKCQTREECANRNDHITKRRQRPTDDPEIHYGLIASGERVIKNSQTRDKWAQEHGVLCFEMEAAGIMNIFPSLVIRGICDYADAFKNKLWQEYAAATAAAYAKLLLGVIASPERSHDALGLVRRRGSASERSDELYHKRRRLD
jgi:nucleoside phosphorylase